jgi:hypothetical protein
MTKNNLTELDDNEFHKYVEYFNDLLDDEVIDHHPTTTVNELKFSSLMFDKFAVIGGYDHNRCQKFSSMRLFDDYGSAFDYARGLIDLPTYGYDYAYVSGIYPNGTMELKEVARVADDGTDVVNLN